MKGVKCDMNIIEKLREIMGADIYVRKDKTLVIQAFQRLKVNVSELVIEFFINFSGPFWEETLGMEFLDIVEDDVNIEVMTNECRKEHSFPNQFLVLTEMCANEILVLNTINDKVYRVNFEGGHEDLVNEKLDEEWPSFEAFLIDYFDIEITEWEREKIDNFKTFLSKSEELRKGYVKSLEPADKDFQKKWLEHFSNIPAFFEEIYSACNGTDRDISEQIYFDFLPGFRLMQVDEIIDRYEQAFKEWPEYDQVIPFLTDYSDGYYAYAKDNDRECVVLYIDGDLGEIHFDVADFWITVIAFYDEGVYFLDEDGYLDYDFEKEGDVGKKYNPKISHWRE